MALVPNGRAPYAPAKVITEFIDRHRNVGIPKIDLETLGRVGVTESLAPRTLASLKLLDFYQEDGTVTEDFDALKRVSSDEFPKRLAQLLTSAYKPIFEIVGDVSQAEARVIDDAFRTFEPAGQRARMVQLFVSLMVYVGIMSDESLRKPGPAPRKKLVVRKSAPPARADGAREVGKPSANGPDQVPSPPPPPSPPSGGEHRTTVELDGIGVVSLVASLNPLLLKKSDRDFFFALVDKMNEWRTSRLPSEGSRTAGSTASEVSTP